MRVNISDVSPYLDLPAKNKSNRVSQVPVFDLESGIQIQLLRMAETGARDGFPIKRIDSYVLVTSKSTERINYPEDQQESSEKEFNRSNGGSLDNELYDRIGEEKSTLNQESAKTSGQAIKRIKCKSKIIETLQKHEELKKKYAALLDKVDKKSKQSTSETHKLQAEAQPDKIQFLTYNEINENDIIQDSINPLKSETSDLTALSLSMGLANPEVISLLNGFNFEHFKLLKFFSEGISGRVYLTKNIRSGMICSVKMIRRSSLNPTNTTQLLREIKIQSFLNHPHIVKLYHVIIDEEYVYLFLQPCLGADLYTNAKQKNGRLGEKQVREIIKQVTIAVEYMHKNDIIHRDLKPENILLHEGVVKICDFGWAVHSPLLRDTRCGTPLYAPPEMFKKELYDSKIDIWNIGILTYELLCGNIPFEIRHVDDFNKIVEEEVYFSDEVHISTSAKDFILGCVHKNPIKRFSIRQAIEHNFLSGNDRYRWSIA